ncbi:hypothetical protein [Demequina sp.]|uniref:hypothetical protein n=1 Tax=Demequina sp. TaxID=2050685 RepID=UPI003A848B41
MKTTTPRGTAIAACLGLALLAGCSSQDATEDTTDAAAATPESSEQPVEQERSMPSGISGEIAYVSDGVAQVQDGDSQTAVRYTDDTTFTEEVEIALADIAVGSCVRVSVEDDVATSVAVTEADEDGECSSGFGGGGRVPGGDGTQGGEPGEMPTAMPEGGMPEGEMPDGGERGEMPTAMPEGEMPEMPSDDGQMPGGFGDMVIGAVTAVEDGSLTIESTDGESTVVTVGADATITGTQATTADAVAVGLCLTAQGEEDGSGGYDATEIALSAAGEEGCFSTSDFGGMGGGMPGGTGEGLDGLDGLDESGE